MANSNIKATFPCDIRRVWETVTDVENYGWRSDLSRTEVMDENRFVEYTTEGYATTFTVTALETCKRWEFDMENSNMKGHWIGLFTQKGEETEVNFTEEVIAKKLFMRPFVGSYLKKQQAQFISDLRKELMKQG